VTGCIDCGDRAVARHRCDTCYQRARRTGEIAVILHRVTADEVQAMRRLRAQGMSMAAVADEVGRGVATVHRHTA